MTAAATSDLNHPDIIGMIKIGRSPGPPGRRSAHPHTPEGDGTGQEMGRDAERLAQ